MGGSEAGTATGKSEWKFLKRIKARATLRSSNFTSGCLFQGYPKGICILMFLIVLFTIFLYHKIWNNLSVHLWMKRRRGTYMHRNIIQSWKWRKSYHLRHGDGLWGHYAKWDEPDKGKYCVKSLIYGISWSTQSWTHRNSRKVAARACKIGKDGDVGKRVQDSNYKMKKVGGPNMKDGDYSWSHCIA